MFHCHRSNISAEEFIEAWQKSETIEEVINRTGMYKSAIYSRRSNYISRGIPLKYIEPKQRKLDIDKLTELAKSLEEK